MSNQADHTIVRLRVPPELKKQIEVSAEKNNRSQSAEMVARLEQSFEQNQNDFNAGYNSCMVHMIIAVSKAMSEKGIPWSDVQKTLIDVVNDFQRLSAEKK